MSVVTVSTMELFIQKELKTENQPRMQEAIDSAEGAVAGRYGFTTLPWDVDSIPQGIVTVIKRCAGRFYDNPQQRSSHIGPDGTNWTGGPARLFTEQEEAILDRFDPRATSAGTIRAALPPYLVPAPCDPAEDESA